MSGSAITPGRGSRGHARTRQPGPRREGEREPESSRVGRGILAAVRLCAVWAVSLLGAAALLAGPGLLLVSLVPVKQVWQPPTAAMSSGADQDRSRFWLLVVLILVPCVVLGARRLVRGGKAGRAGEALCGTAGAILLLPPVLTLADLVVHRGSLAAGSHGAGWLSLLGVPLLACGLLGMRWVAGLHRRMAGSWSGEPVPAPYRAAPPTGGRPLGERARLWTRWVLTDPATWRDLLWTAFTGAVGCVLAALVAIPVYVAAQMLATFLGSAPEQPVNVHVFLPLLTVTTGFLTVLPVVLWAAPRLIAGYARSARYLLGPSRQEELAQRVDHLAQTRSDTLDAGAAEMRRIERDLHDGAQARLVAMGMALDTAQHLVAGNPEAARALLAEIKESSAKALVELRDLIRGIHPPVLADRGLADAVHALALDMPHRVHFAAELPGRVPAPVESAAYFAVSELLANVTKHAEAGQIWIEIGRDGDRGTGTLRITVTDDGRGGADPAGGTGLRGVERRLAAFDGILAVSSPPGGPTIVNMEIPCALSSPKTSSS